MKKYRVICYHYVRPEKDRDPFPLLLGTRIKDFKEHVDALKRSHHILTPTEVIAYHNGGGIKSPYEHDGLLFTFDDGLSDHYEAARILHEEGIRALFFIPTCILKDNQPANPNIIHYGLAAFRIPFFLDAMQKAAAKEKVDIPTIEFVKGKTDPWDAISAIKRLFKSGLNHRDGRSVLLRIFNEHMLPQKPDLLTSMHLDQQQIEQMVSWGHSIGVHTHTHVSVGRFFEALSKEEFEEEIITPRHYLEKLFSTPVDTFGYPFGGVEDCLSAPALLEKTNEYKLAFTVEEKVNTRNTSAYELGRYQVMQKDTTDTVLEHLLSLAE